MGTEDERVVLVADDGSVLGTAPKATVHGPQTPLHLGFSCYVFDADDNLLVTRRALDKRTFPGVWTNSFCGHPAPGEPLSYAVRRRAADELGLEVGEPRLVLPGFRYRAEMAGVVELELCPVLAVHVDRELRLRPRPDEVAEWAWEPWDDVVSSIAGGREVSVWCREQVTHLEALGAPSTWPDASTDLLPAALQPPLVAPPTDNVGQLLDHWG
ncbi:MAG TPA: isopentenyl-diphosphate Delta-isomerase [Humibacillus xanthopallidus]|nr:isopentenyl-diphosphate Delta-isomerase [Humibacillus xanthopallidus]